MGFPNHEKGDALLSLVRVRIIFCYNYFWSVDNSREVLDKLNDVNNPSSIHTYDFSTLYTNLPLDLVRNELFEIIDRYFDINERKSNKYIVLNHFWKTAQFASVNRKGSYDRDKLKTALDYLLFNSFVRFRPQVFKQIKGIPMRDTVRQSVEFPNTLS